MPIFKFFVGRKNTDPVQCSAEMPSKADLPRFAGGKIKVQTPKGVVEVELPSATDMIIDQMTILLQHGVRDFVFPLADAPTATKRRRSGYEG
jgi:hypothetical protein